VLHTRPDSSVASAVAVDGNVPPQIGAAALRQTTSPAQDPPTSPTVPRLVALRASRLRRLVLVRASRGASRPPGLVQTPFP
jgi:hypothetical protein